MVEEQKQIRQAWVVFTNHTCLPWLKIFKRDFRHCFVIINDGTHWISIDPMAHYMDVVVHEVSASFDLPSWLVGRGHHVARAHVNADLKTPAPWMVFTCVEACKRVLGIHNRFIVTPWQLFKFLRQPQGQDKCHGTRRLVSIFQIFKKESYYYG